MLIELFTTEYDVENKFIEAIATKRHKYNDLSSYEELLVNFREKLNLKSRLGFRKNYLQPDLDAGLIGITEPNKPTSKNKKFIKI